VPQGQRCGAFGGSARDFNLFSERHFIGMVALCG
jgi:hypothetical protein